LHRLGVGWIDISESMYTLLIGCWSHYIR